jgi:hypothetical protein
MHGHILALRMKGLRPFQCGPRATSLYDLGAARRCVVARADPVLARVFVLAFTCNAIDGGAGPERYYFKCFEGVEGIVDGSSSVICHLPANGERWSWAA